MNAFTLSNPRPLEIAVAKKLDSTFGSNTEWRQFSNGEWHVRILKNPPGALVIGRTDPPGDHLLQTLTLLDTLKRNGVKNITLLVPYFGYGRQDRIVRKGDHVPADLFLKLFKACGAQRVLTVDLHSGVTQDHAVLTLVNIDIAPLFVQMIKKEVKKSEAFTIVSPDRGGRKRADHFRDLLNPRVPVCWIKKLRDPITGNVRSLEFFGVKRGTTALIIDDILDTGGTIKECVRMLKKQGFKTFYLLVTHPVFSADSVQTIRALKFKRIFVSNTIPLSKKAATLPITAIDVSKVVISYITKDAPDSKN